MRCDRRIYRYVVILLLTTSLVLSIMSLQKCTFFMIGDNKTPYKNLQGYGLFRTPVYDNEELPASSELLGCIAYPEEMTFDRYFISSRVIAVSIPIIVFCALCLFILIEFVVRNGRERLHKIVGLGLVPLCFVCQMTVFVVFMTDQCWKSGRCTQGTASILADVNALILLLIKFALDYAPLPSHPALELDLKPWSETEKNQESILPTITDQQGNGKESTCETEYDTEEEKLGKKNLEDENDNQQINDNSINSEEQNNEPVGDDNNNSSDNQEESSGFFGIILKSVKEYTSLNGEFFTTTTEESPNRDGTMTIKEYSDTYPISYDDHVDENFLSIDPRSNNVDVTFLTK